jgi:hypothetical protein
MHTVAITTNPKSQKMLSELAENEETSSFY